MEFKSKKKSSSLEELQENAQKSKSPSLGNRASLSPSFSTESGNTVSETSTFDAPTYAPMSSGMGAASAPIQAKKDPNKEDQAGFTRGKAGSLAGRGKNESAADMYTRANRAINPLNADESRAMIRKIEQALPAGENIDREIATSQGYIKGLNISRISANTARDYMRGPEEETIAMFQNLTSGNDNQVALGMFEYKNRIYSGLKDLEMRYGTMLTQMHPEDVFDRIDIEQYTSDRAFMQDMTQLTDDNRTGVALFDDNNPEDQDYKRLSDYYFKAFTTLDVYCSATNPDLNDTEDMRQFNANLYETQLGQATALEENVHSDMSFSPKEFQSYKKRGAKVAKKRLGRVIGSRWR